MGLAAALTLACSVPVATGTGGPRVFTPDGVRPARFEDPSRASLLAGGFAGVDRAFTEFAARARVPGLAWGVIVDGRLAHEGALGVRDPKTSAPARPDSVIRIASMCAWPPR